jgi:2-methylisocitrate lyase-like PEP mutase family enzyme
MDDPTTKALRFRTLHDGPDPLLLPNPWDPGTARLLAHLGFDALATTSLGVENVHGRTRVRPRDILDNLRAVVEATPLPVNADLENGFADEPAIAARAIGEAHACGAVGGSIEDTTMDGGPKRYDVELAVERVHAAVEAARALPTPFTLTARADGLLYGLGDVDDAIRRLQSFERVGADVLYAPGLRTLDQMRTVVQSVGRPVNVVMGFADPSITIAQLREIGVRRISIGGALSRLALQAFLDGAREMRAGRFGFVQRIAPVQELRAAFR